MSKERTDDHTLKEKYKPTNTKTSTRVNKGGMVGLSLSSLVIIVLAYFAYKYFTTKNERRYDYF
jgi:hypothetical protein